MPTEKKLTGYSSVDNKEAMMGGVEIYRMVREEIDENIKKQDYLWDLMISVLGLSLVFNTWYENVVFLIAVILISAVILSRILNCRNCVYYLSAYLMTDEMNECCDWENKVSKFKEKLSDYKKHPLRKKIFFWTAFRSSASMKNLGNIILCSFVFVQLLPLLAETEQMWLRIGFFAVACIAYLMNLVFTIIICVDKTVKKQYKSTWDEILKEPTSEYADIT